MLFRDNPFIEPLCPNTFSSHWAEFAWNLKLILFLFSSLVFTVIYSVVLVYFYTLIFLEARISFTETGGVEEILHRIRFLRE